MIFDTHAHLNFFEFNSDREDIIKKCLESGVGMINVGTNLKSSEKAIEIAQNFDNVFASVGLHPLNIASEFLRNKGYSGEAEGILENSFDIEKYKFLAKNKKVVAIGETGLDYWYKPKGTAKKELFKEEQKKIFIEHLDLAEELNLPVIIHCRSAFDDLYEIISKRNIKGVLHCFTGSIDDMKRFADLGLYIGINGIIFKIDLKEVMSKVPLEKVLIETDCPYLSPPQFETRNNPMSINQIIDEFSHNRSENIEEIKIKTSNNAVELFGLN
ncbi:MAG: TatD family hydrolase [Candidatus Pacebacteria bacterium]|nr:TatD family hydrolase [Candidatus Paceibacterota bacterium]